MFRYRKALTYAKRDLRQSNGTLKARIMRYRHRASRKSPTGQPKNAQNGVTANFCAFFNTRPCGKSDESRAELCGQMVKAQFSWSFNMGLGSVEALTWPKFWASLA
jgi:hypothetical protein